MNILNKLTIKHLTMNKKRTIVTIIGVILSCALMVGIGLLLSTLRDYSIKEIISFNGDQHLRIDNIPSSKIDFIKNNQHIKEYKLEQYIGYAYTNIQLENTNTDALNKYFYISAADNNIIDDLIIKEGRAPKNNKEVIISDNIIDEGIADYKVGDEITLNIGNRYYNNELIKNNYLLMSTETEKEQLKDLKLVTYKIVGIFENSIYDNFKTTGYPIYTKYDNNTDNPILAYITLKKPKNAYTVGDNIIKQLGFEINSDEYNYSIEYNDSLISMYGASRYNNLISSMNKMITIILSLISIACIIVIYNSFAISVMERKKQFGLFSSIGATKKQLRKTVLFEALIVGLIGIPLGIASGFLGIWVVIQIINNLLTDYFTIGFTLAAYPTFIIIPIIFMIVVILVSAFLPARKASKITPIEAIRLNDDIKIKGKKIKTNKLVQKVFGIEGEIALKNMKRNKGKYRITVVSLFISIVLFISFSSILKYGLLGSTDVLGDLDFDVAINSYNDTKEQNDLLYKKLSNTSGINKSIKLDYYLFYSEIDPNFIDNSFKKIINYDNNYEMDVNLIVVNEKEYTKIKEEIGLKENKAVIINQYSKTTYTSGNRKTNIGKTFKENKNLKMQIQYNTNMDNEDENDVTNGETEIKKFELSNFYFTDKIPFGFKQFIYSSGPIIIISDDILNEILKNNNIGNPHTVMILYDTDNSDKINDKYEELSKDITNNTYLTDVNKQMKAVRNMIFIIKLLLYGFISLVTLIGVTSVFNTINTSIALRRKEFSVLRSIGLTPQGFNKILRFETIMFGIKSLLYAIPVSIGITYLIHISISDVVGLNFTLPWGSIIIATFGVFIIVSIAMFYATSKIKHENILDAIREENI